MINIDSEPGRYTHMMRLMQDYLRIMYVHTNLYMYYYIHTLPATLVWCLVGQENDLKERKNDYGLQTLHIHTCHASTHA